MISAFGHHLIPLLPVNGSQGGVSAKAMLSASKEALRSAEQTNRVLKLACRVETALVPLQCNFFSAEPSRVKARGAAWSVIKETANLRWILPSSDPELIRASLPADWLGKGYRNVCFGAIVNDPGSFREIAAHLSAIPCHFRMALFPSVPRADAIRDYLNGIQWIVVVGDNSDEASADALRSICHSSGASFLFIRRDGTLTDPPEASGHATWSEHPFGPELQLRRPTHPDLRHGEPMLLVWDDDPPWFVPKEEATSDLDLDPAVPIHAAEATELNPVNLDDPPAINTTTQEGVATLLPVAPAHERQLISKADRKDFARLDTVVRRGVAAFVECGLALAEIHDRKLWRAGDHPTWEGYLRSVLGMSKPHAHRLAQAARIATEISESLPIGNASLPTVRPASEFQIRPLCRLKDAEQRTTAWTLATQRAEGQPTAKMISEVVAELMAEEPRPAAPRATSKQQLQDTIRKLRASVVQGLPSEQITSLLDGLESLLKLA